MNPYEAPIQTEDRSVISDQAKSGVPLTWFAATVAASTYIVGVVFWLASVFQSEFAPGAAHMAEALIGQTLVAASCFTVPAVLLYAVSRQVLKQRFQFVSTPGSSLFAGFLAAVFYAAIMYSLWESDWNDNVVIRLAMLLAVPYSGLIVVAESRIAGAREPESRDVTLAEAKHESASLLWFSAAFLIACFLVVLVFAALDGFPAPSIAGMLVQILSLSCVGCVLATLYHGFVAIIHSPRKSFSVQSRLVAALTFLGVFIGLVWPIGILIEKTYGAANSASFQLPLFLFVIPLVAAMCSVTVDRRLGSRMNTTVA